MKGEKTISENTALSRLMKICSRSEKSSYDIRKKLNEWGLEAKAEQIIKKLVEEKYIDDIRFAAAFSHDKIFLNKWGKLKVSYLLRSQHISTENIQRVFELIDDHAYCDMLFEELKKKTSSLRKYNALQKKTKLYAFGIQRGYESDLIRRYFESLHL
jgi:regulatory protein